MANVKYMDKKYSIIYADPPWPQKSAPKMGGYKVVDGKQIFNTLNNKSINLPYPIMSVKDICELPVKNISADDAYLFMWVTNKHLPNAFEIIKSWGFTYSTTLVWCKKPMGGGMGGTFKVSTEFLLFARRGKLSHKNGTKGTWFDIKRTYKNGFPVHSLKPEFFRELIELTAPSDLSKLELFARKQHPGWDVFGNEVSNSIKLTV